MAANPLVTISYLILQALNVTGKEFGPQTTNPTTPSDTTR